MIICRKDAKLISTHIFTIERKFGWEIRFIIVKLQYIKKKNPLQKQFMIDLKHFYL